MRDPNTKVKSINVGNTCSDQNWVMVVHWVLASLCLVAVILSILLKLWSIAVAS